MKKPGGKEEGDSGGKGVYYVFRDVKNTVVNSNQQGHDSPLSRQPRRKHARKPAGTGIFSKWSRKRSMQPVSSGGGVPAKKAYLQSRVCEEGEELMVEKTSQCINKIDNSCAKEEGSLMTDSFTMRKRTMVLHGGLRPEGIPSAALAVSRTFSQPPPTLDDSTIAPLQIVGQVEEEFSSFIHTAGPTEVHRHFDFVPLHDSLSPDEFHAPYLLKTLDNPQVCNTAFRSISGEILKVLLSEMEDDQFKRRFVLIDCRYPYEYQGGHIKHAINLFEPDRVESLFYPADEELFAEINAKVPIFYCEFSQKRGPQMAKQLRKCDRGRSGERWPYVDYKEIYLLDQGYRKFFCDYKELCEPQHYVPMNHANYKSELRKYDHHKRRADRVLIPVHEDGRVMGAVSDSRLQWDVPSSRPPLSPAMSPVPLFFHHRRYKPEGDDQEKGEREAEFHA